MIDTLTSMPSKEHNKRLLENWGKQINAVDKALKKINESCGGRDPLSKPMTDYKKIRLAQILENTKQAIGNAQRRAIMEGTQVPDIGPFKLHAFDMISGLYPTMISDELVSVQAMPQRLGQVFFLSYLYGSDRGEVRRGQSMLSPWTGAADYNNYAGERIDKEVLAENTSTSTENVDLFLSNVPLRAGTLTLITEAGEWSDNGEGAVKDSTGGTLATVDYRTGKIVFMSGSMNVMGGGTGSFPALIEASYFQNLEYGPTQAGQVNVRVDCATLNATPHKLRALYAFDAGYDLQMSQGVDIDEELLKTCTAEIRHERDGNVIKALYNQAGNTSTWNRHIPVGISQIEHYNSFFAQLFADSNTIYYETKRSMGNWVVCGKQAIDILNAVGAPRFVGNGLGSQSGPHFAGVVDGRLKVFFDPFLPDDAYLVGFKGENFYDCGYVIGDYLPIFSTQMVMLDDFVGRRGYCSMYATKMINNRMYVAGHIVNM